MSAVEETHSPFHLLLHEIGKELKMGDVRYMKYLLQGHINKETLEPLKAGHELIDLLRKRRLVSEKKLAFLRKLLIEANCLKLVNLVDDFKEKFTPVATVGKFLHCRKLIIVASKADISYLSCVHYFSLRSYYTVIHLNLNFFLQFFISIR